MKCPFCGTNSDKVIDSREVTNGQIIRRRRKCSHCGRKFTTKETLVNLPIMVMKQGGIKESFDRGKLRKGIAIACNKRPISAERIDLTVGKIEGELQDLKTRDIPAQTIGKLAMKHLRKLDDVAYVRFASVYHKFESKEEFLEELKRLGA
ncbi:MAG: transcriptional regulator NrdR [bacterium]